MDRAFLKFLLVRKMKKAFFKFLLGGLGCGAVTFVASVWLVYLAAINVIVPDDLLRSRVLMGLALSVTFTAIGGFGLLYCAASRDQKR